MQIKNKAIGKLSMALWRLSYSLLFFTVEYLDHLDGGYGDACSGAEDSSYTCLIQEVVVLGRDYTSGGYDDVLAAELLELFDYLRNQSLVAGCQRRNSEDVNVVFHSLTGGFCRSLEQRSHIDVESAVGITGGYYFCAAVVAVLTHLGDHDTWLSTFAFCEILAHLLGADEVGVLFCFVAIHA